MTGPEPGGVRASEDASPGSARPPVPPAGDRREVRPPGRSVRAHPATPRRRAPAPSRVLLLVAAGLVPVLLAALVGVLALQRRDRDRLAEVQRPEGPALTAARDAGRLLLSYDSSRLEDDLTAALALTAQPYTTTFRQATQRTVWPAAIADRAAVSTTVRAVGPTSATTSDRLVALVLVDRSTRRGDAAEPALDSVALRVTLVPRQGRWLVRQLEVL